MRKLLIGLGVAVLVLVLLVGWIGLAGHGVFGEIDSQRIAPSAPARSVENVSASVARFAAGAVSVGASPESQILFGDLHVHTTISVDAFYQNLPITGGAGAMNAADACDFARHCANLDFWSINDHAKMIYPQDWRNTVTAIRECNARSGDPSNPDTVAFLGWEWTQAGITPDEHYGHKNVVLAHTDDDRIPDRPIAAEFRGGGPPLSKRVMGAASLAEDRFDDLAARAAAYSGYPECGDGNVRDREGDCHEVAPTPVELFRKLDEWGHDAIVIPHGTAWGIYTPPNSTWEKQLEGAMQDPERQTMIEVYSGHGDSEVYRDWRALDFAEDGTPICPEARANYLPECQRAGQIIEERCLEAGESTQECATRAEEARHNAAAAGKLARATVPGTRNEDWLDAAQCRDCDQPSFNYRPGGSAQYIAALGNFDDDPAVPRRFRMGFMASSDNHSARPGTGFKEIRAMTDGGMDHPEQYERLMGLAEMLGIPGGEEPAARSRPIEAGANEIFAAAERAGSFQYTGGLVAVHAAGRDRAAIWSALDRKQIYGTSGPRILLWFDMLTEEGEVPMGSEQTLLGAPTFRVRAVGSFEQLPGCPSESIDALDPAALEKLCLGECYHPSDVRRPITRIEVVRIRPQVRPGEDIASLIDDPWQTHVCPADGEGCIATFTDPDFQRGGRDAVYYARVFEEAIDTVNGTPLNCEYDEAGRCIAVAFCSLTDECLRPDEPRAWSSPIYVDHPEARRTD